MHLSLLLQGEHHRSDGQWMDFKDSGINSHVQFEILGSSFSETFGKDIKRNSCSEVEPAETMFCSPGETETSSIVIISYPSLGSANPAAPSVFCVDEMCPISVQLV
ncbi:hypothetical protein KUCAC02_036862 [Chaenocephalus aceratus]|nr:hypothetical protein KUCAC02_036862 [Chaenocephalus aceratus]